MNDMLVLRDALVIIAHRVLEPFSTGFGGVCDLIEHIYKGEYGDRDTLIAAMRSVVEGEADTKVTACVIEIATACSISDIRESVIARQRKRQSQALIEAINEYLAAVEVSCLQ